MRRVILTVESYRVIAMMSFIGRSKLVLDFALTLHFIHLVIVTFYTGFLPRHVAWWATLILSSVVTVIGGTYGCRWRELRPISFGGNGRNAANGEGSSQAATENRNTGGEPGDEEMGFSRGRGRGRGRDGAGEYEMVGMKNDGNR